MLPDSGLPPPPPTDRNQFYAPDEGAMCSNCGYLLSGLTLTGRCPECGSGYDPGSVSPWRGMPSRRGMFVMFAWPWFGIAGAVLLALAVQDPGVLLLALVLLPVAFVNAVGSLLYLGRRVPKFVRRSGLIALLMAIGLFPALAAVASIVVPVLTFGACVIMRR